MQYPALMMSGGRDEGVVYRDDSEVVANVVWRENVRSWDLWKKRWLPRLAAEKAALQAARL